MDTHWALSIAVSALFVCGGVRADAATSAPASAPTATEALPTTPGGLAVGVDAEAGHLLLRDARSGRLLRHWPMTALKGGPPARQATVAAAPQRPSLLVVFDTLPELWELSTDPNAPPVYDGWVHDWRMLEGVPAPGYLHPRRSPLPQVAQALAPEALGPYVLLALAHPQDGCVTVALWHLDARRLVAQAAGPESLRAQVAAARVRPATRPGADDAAFLLDGQPVAWPLRRAIRLPSGCR